MISFPTFKTAFHNRIPERVCEGCEKLFRPKRRTTAKCCSPKCNQKVYNKVNLQRARDQRYRRRHGITETEEMRMTAFQEEKAHEAEMARLAAFREQFRKDRGWV